LSSSSEEEREKKREQDNSGDFDGNQVEVKAFQASKSETSNPSSSSGVYKHGRKKSETQIVAEKSVGPNWGGTPGVLEAKTNVQNCHMKGGCELSFNGRETFPKKGGRP